MTTTHRTLVNHTFHGGRFDDGGVDVDAIQELIRYKTLVTEVAKELWRRNHPERERLPKNFEDSLAVRFYEVKNNCATIPLERFLGAEDRERVWQAEDELDDAVGLVADAIDAAGKDALIPESFPKGLLGLFQDYGKSLRDDEWIEQRPVKRTVGVRFDAAVRERLVRLADVAYEDTIDVTGEVTMARVSKPRMAIQLADGREVEAAFRPEHESNITTALKDHQTARLRVIGRGQFSANGQIQRIVEVASIQLLASGAPTFQPNARPIWEEFAEVLAKVPSDELAKLPSDGAERHDFYIYGQQGTVE